MAFVTKVWKNRLVEFAGRRKLKNVATGEEIIFDVTRSEGVVSQAGDAFSDANMNNLEQRIKNQFDTIDSNLANFIKVVRKTMPITVAANSYDGRTDYNLLTENGYTPVGIIGFEVSDGAPISACSVRDNSTACIRVWNTYTSTRNFVVTFYVLYQKLI